LRSAPKINAPRAFIQELFDINQTQEKLTDELQKIHPIAV
jgi:hypothetical protein